MSLRIAAYNLHKCKGMDGRVRPRRVAGVMLRLDADVIAAQEVLLHQAESLTEELGRAGYALIFGENRKIAGVPYGNATFTRVSVESSRNYDITILGREKRGVLRTDILTESGIVHVFNVHLGTSYFERREQARLLLSKRILLDTGLGPRVICGDFNEWTRGLCSRTMAKQFACPVLRRSYPGGLPLLRLDHIYFDPEMRFERAWTVRDRTAMMASDHLPLVAEFQ